jgi:hypothetical protein
MKAPGLVFQHPVKRITILTETHRDSLRAGDSLRLNNPSQAVLTSHRLSQLGDLDFARLNKLRRPDRQVNALPKPLPILPAQSAENETGFTSAKPPAALSLKTTPAFVSDSGNGVAFPDNSASARRTSSSHSGVTHPSDLNA